MSSQIKLLGILQNNLKILNIYAFSKLPKLVVNIDDKMLPGRSFMKIEILGDIHKICISRKIFIFHNDAKDILEHMFD